MMSIKLVPSLPSNIPTNNRPGDISQRPPEKTTAPPEARFGRYQVFEYDVLTGKEKIVQNFLKQSRFPHDKDDPKLQESLETSIYFGTPIIQHAALCIPVCRAIGKYLSMREIVTLACLSSSNRLLISTLIEQYYSHSPAKQANYRSLWQSHFASPPEQLTLWLEKYFDQSDKAWVEADPLRQAALHRYLSSKKVIIECAITLPKFYGPIYCMTTLPNGQIITGGQDHTLKVWDLTKDTGAHCVATLSGHVEQISCILVLSSSKVISGSYDHNLRVWDLTKPPEQEQCVAILEGHTLCVNGIAVFHCGRRIISCSNDNTLKVWDLTRPAGKECVATLQDHTGRVTCITVLSDNRAISSSYDGVLRVWNLTNPEGKECAAILTGHTSQVNCITVLPDNRIITGSNDRSIRVWDLTKPVGKECVAILNDHYDWVRCIAMLPNGLIITGSNARALLVLDLLKSEKDKCFAAVGGHTGFINSIAILPYGHIITNSDDSALRTWDPSNLIDLTEGILPKRSGKRSGVQIDNESKEETFDNSRETESWYRSCQVM